LEFRQISFGKYFSSTMRFSNLTAGNIESFPTLPLKTVMQTKAITLEHSESLQTLHPKNI